MNVERTCKTSVRLRPADEVFDKAASHWLIVGKNKVIKEKTPRCWPASGFWHRHVGACDALHGFSCGVLVLLHSSAVIMIMIIIINVRKVGQAPIRGMCKDAIRETCNL